MSVSALVPDNTGRTVYITPQQSPSALDHEVRDPFANPEGIEDGGDGKEIKKDEKAAKREGKVFTNGIHPPHEDVIHPLHQNGISSTDLPLRQHAVNETNASYLSNAPEIPPKVPVNGDTPNGITMKKEPPELPARPPSQPVSRLPKPTPSLPSTAIISATKAAATPLRQRTTLPPPTIIEDFSESSNAGHRPLKYSREPHRLIAYLIPFPKPKLTKNTDNEELLPEVSNIFGSA